MGKGKGNFKRWCTIVYPGKIFIEHVNLSPKSYIKYIKKLKLKLKLRLNYVYIANSFIKKTFNKNIVVPNNGAFDLVKIRKTIYMTQKQFNKNIITNYNFN